MINKCSNRYSHYDEILLSAISNGYSFYTCYDYYQNKKNLLEGNKIFCVIRHDVDFYHDRVITLAEIESKYGIRSSYFFRIHANEYNILSYDVISIIKYLHKLGHEIGLHAEPLDIREATEFSPNDSLHLGKQIIESIIQAEIVGIASHNDPTPVNNLEFFNFHSPQDFGFKYEAYSKDFQLFYNSYYVSDSHPWYWKTYINGKIDDNNDCLCQAINRKLSPLYCLIHPHMWYNKHYNLIKY